jgi:quercetin dioxygenase-like cupin family protein
MFRLFKKDFTWQDVDLLAYKQEGGAPFKDVTRQVLFSGDDLKSELRYFEIAPGGHTTLERHEHVHAAMILRGVGHCLVGNEVRAVHTHDLITVPLLTWHQLRAGADEPMGFLCMVDAVRDKPQLPSKDDLEALLADPIVVVFLQGENE